MRDWFISHLRKINKPILFLSCHSKDQNFIGDRFSKYSYDSLIYLLKHVAFSQYAAIIYATCNQLGKTPDLAELEIPIPIIGSTGEVYKHLRHQQSGTTSYVIYGKEVFLYS